MIPRVITVDKNTAYPISIHELKNDKILPKNVGIIQIKYLNNIVEQDNKIYQADSCSNAKLSVF